MFEIPLFVTFLLFPYKVAADMGMAKGHMPRALLLLQDVLAYSKH